MKTLISIILTLICFNGAFAESKEIPELIISQYEPNQEFALISKRLFDSVNYYVIEVSDDYASGYSLASYQEGNAKILSFGEDVWPVIDYEIPNEAKEFFLSTLIDLEIKDFPGGVAGLSKALKKFPDAYDQRGEDYKQALKDKGVIFP